MQTHCKEILRIVYGAQGRAEAVVKTVIPLPPAEEKELKETLQKLFEGQKVKLEHNIDPSILDGLVVEFGQKVFDMSVKTRVRFLQEAKNTSIFKCPWKVKFLQKDFWSFFCASGNGIA